MIWSLETGHLWSIFYWNIISCQSASNSVLKLEPCHHTASQWLMNTYFKKVKALFFLNNPLCISVHRKESSRLYVLHTSRVGYRHLWQCCHGKSLVHWGPCCWVHFFDRVETNHDNDAVLQISPETPLICALQMFAERRVSALPVVNKAGWYKNMMFWNVWQPCL